MPDLPRRPYLVGAVKIAYELRDVAHAVLTPADDRGFFNIIGGEDDPAAGHTAQLGENVVYRVELTDAEADQFRAASNCRYVELDTAGRDTAGATAIPRAASMEFMRATFSGVGDWHGRDVLIGLLDGGTTTAVRSYLDATMVAKQNFSADPEGADEITSDHGCLVAPCLIPVGGRFLDAIVTTNAGVRTVSAATAGMVWCADQGAKVLNYSGSHTNDSTAWVDALNYLKTRNIQLVCSAGNDGLNQINYPARYSQSYSNVHSSIAFNEATATRWTGSNYDNTASGCAPGDGVLGLTPTAAVVAWSGSSASAPHKARLIAMGATGSKYTTAQVGAALKANTRATGQPAEQQGAGAYSLQAALTALGGFTGAGADYHPVALIWPASDRWPEDGELDFMENSRPGDDHAEAYLHYPHPASVAVQQEHVTKAGVDLSQWHNFAFEKTAAGITGYLDGVQWFHYADGAITGRRSNIQAMPAGHLALQLDNFTGSSGLIPATMEVDWVKVYTVAPTTGGGTGGGGTSTGTLADRLKIGFGQGLTKCNIGIGFLPSDGPSSKKGQHVDYALDVLTRDTLPAEFAGYVDLRDDGAVRLTSYIGGGHTPNSQKARTEFRALKQNGVDKESFDSASGVHYAWIDCIVRRACPGRPDICLVQIHAADDDLGMIRWINGSLISTYGDSGRPGTLATGVAIGTRMKLMMKTERVGSQTQIGYYYSDMSTPKAVQNYGGAAGNYMKIGNYNQADTSTDDTGESAVVDVYGLGVWHSGEPEPALHY